MMQSQTPSQADCHLGCSVQYGSMYRFHGGHRIPSHNIAKNGLLHKNMQLANLVSAWFVFGPDHRRKLLFTMQ